MSVEDDTSHHISLACSCPALLVQRADTMDVNSSPSITSVAAESASPLMRRTTEPLKLVGTTLRRVKGNIGDLLSSAASTCPRSSSISSTPSSYVVVSTAPTKPNVLITSLPNEILLLIGSYCDRLSTLNSLAQTNRRLMSVFSPLLYQRGIHPDNGRSVLLWAVQRNNATIVRSLLEVYNVRASCHDENWNTALHLAAKLGHTDMVKLLLSFGANIESKNHKHCTPLHLAAQSGHSDIVQLLFEYGAELEAYNLACHTPLLVAVDNLHEDTVRELLAHGANPNAESGISHRDKILPNWTALHLAVSHGSITLVRMLVGAGANINHVSVRDRDTPLGVAVRYAGYHVLQSDGPCRSIRAEDEMMFRVLLELGADVELALDPTVMSRYMLFSLPSWEKTPFEVVQDALIAIALSVSKEANKFMNEGRCESPSKTNRIRKSLSRITLEYPPTVSKTVESGRSSPRAAIRGMISRTYTNFVMKKVI